MKGFIVYPNPNMWDDDHMCEPEDDTINEEEESEEDESFFDT